MTTRQRVSDLSPEEKLRLYNERSCDLCGWVLGGLSSKLGRVRCRICDLLMCIACADDHEARHQGLLACCLVDLDGSAKLWAGEERGPVWLRGESWVVAIMPRVRPNGRRPDDLPCWRWEPEHVGR